MRLGLVAFLLLVLSACGAQRWMSDLAYEMREVAVSLDDGNCSGTLIGGTRVVTAKHCIAGKKEIAVTFWNGEKRAARAKWMAAAHDAGVIEFEGAKAKVFAAIDCSPMEWGEPFQWVGQPSMLQWNFGAGFVSQDGPVKDFRLMGDGDFVAVSANFNPGDSGAGLISNSGRIRGVVTAYITTKTDVFSSSQSGNGLMTPASAFCGEMEKAL
jgi:S1-C subfamily serine protease